MKVRLSLTLAAALALSTMALSGQTQAAVAPACTPTTPPGAMSTPAPCATGAVTPIVDLPGGSDQRSPNTPQAVLGVQTTPARSVQGLPATGTEGPSFPLAALGLAFTALGGVLLRRRDTTL